MARLRRDWYLEGWSREYCETDGKTRMVWKYTGEYFRYELSPRGLRRLKAACALLTVLMAALWFHLSMLRVAGREFFFVGAEWFLCIIPFMVLILGAASGISVMMSALLHNSSTILVVANSLRLMFMKPGDGRI